MSKKPVLPKEFILVGVIQKPYGLLGELKVKPESFDFERHAKLKTVYCRNAEEIIETHTVIATRADSRYWYLRLHNIKTPEAAAHLSGWELLLDGDERLELPEGMVYFSDLPGLTVVDELGAEVGMVLEVMETGTIEYIVVQTTKGNVSVPWKDDFVKKIDLASKTVAMDLSTLRGVLF